MDLVNDTDPNEFRYTTQIHPFSKYENRENSAQNIDVNLDLMTKIQVQQNL
jgi:hypothetical protein